MKHFVKMVLLPLFMGLSLGVSQVHSGGMAEDTRTGMLTGAANHQAAGQVMIKNDDQGKVKLHMMDIQVDRVPDGRVYLTNGGDYRKGVELGKLTRFSGHLEYPIPSHVNPDEYDSVVIWCKKFDVEIGHSYFEKSMMGEKDMMMKKGMKK